MKLPEIPEWKSDATVRAEAQLDEATHALAMELERAEQLLEQTPDEPLTDEEVDRFRRQCTGPEWDKVAMRIGRGEFTWRDIAEGNIGYDEDIDSAMRSLRPKPDLDAPGGPAPSAGPGTEDDEDYFAQERFIERE